MAFPGWLKTALTIAVPALACTPAAPFIPIFQMAVNAAEQIPGANGAQKLQAATQISQAAIFAAQQAGVHVDAPVTAKAIQDGVNAVVSAVNSFHGKETKAA